MFTVCEILEYVYNLNYFLLFSKTDGTAAESKTLPASPVTGAASSNSLGKTDCTSGPPVYPQLYQPRQQTLCTGQQSLDEGVPAAQVRCFCVYETCCISVDF